MLKINNSRPSQVFFNENEVKAIKISTEENATQPCWGKSFSIVLTTPDHASFQITRTSSVYENASHNQTPLYNGSTIYYGDIIHIKLIPDENYIVKSISYNGGTTTNSTLSVSLISTAYISGQVTYVPSWHTVFSGQSDSTHCSSSTAKNYSMYFSGLKEGVSTKITGFLMKESSTVVQAFSSSIPISCIYNSIAQTINSATTNYLNITLKKPSPVAFYKSPYFRISKIEQYY